MNKLDMESKDIVKDNLEYIKERFPEAVTEENGELKLNPDSLIQSLSSVIIDDKKEKYELTWPGKKQAIVEGNTRTTALFIEKYLISLGYNVDNSLFKDKSVYFRNALVRSNYFNNYLNIKEDSSYLVKFYENLLLGKNNNLHSKDLIVQKLFEQKLK